MMRPRQTDSKRSTYQLRSLPEALDDNMWADTLFDVPPNLLQQLCGKQDDTRRPVTDFGVLRARDVD